MESKIVRGKEVSLLEGLSTWILKSLRIRIRSGVELTVVIINPEIKSSQSTGSGVTMGL